MGQTCGFITVMNVLDEMLEFENSPHVLEFSFLYDKILMWPFVRWFLFYEGYKKFFGVQDGHFQWKRPQPMDLLRYLYLTIRFNPYTRNKARYLFFSTGVVNSFKVKGRYFNRVHDYYALIRKNQSVIIEDSYRRKYRRPRFFPNVRYHDYIGLKAGVVGRMKTVKRMDLISIEEFVSYMKLHFPIVLPAEIYDTAKLILETTSKKLATLHSCYKKLFLRIKPKMVLLEDASYGTRSYILKWAKDLGITTAEPQHGFVSLNHPAYNFGSEVINSREYCRYMPDYFLCFGPFWERNIRTCSQKVNIGGAHLHSRKRIFSESGQKDMPDKKTILIVSDAVNPDFFVRLVVKLAELIRDKAFEITFKPHPGEIPVVSERYGKLLSLEGISIDGSIDVFESIYNADYIVGTFSTVLFEAIGFEKPTFVFHDHYCELHMGKDIGTRFKTAEDLYDKIIGHEISVNVDTNDLWNTGWRENYADFLAKFEMD